MIRRTVLWVFKKFPSPRTKYILPICYTKVVIGQCSQVCQASNRLQSVVGSNKTKYNQNVRWNMRQRHRELECYSQLSCLPLFLLLCLLCFLCDLPTSMNEAASTATTAHSASLAQASLSIQSPIIQLPLLVNFKTNVFKAIFTIFLPPATRSWWKASLFNLNTFFFLIP